jgi:hypothetical protein
MTPQATDRIEGGLASCHGSAASSLRKKDLETMKMAHKLLGAPTIGGKSAQAWGGGGGS